MPNQGKNHDLPLQDFPHSTNTGKWLQSNSLVISNSPTQLCPTPLDTITSSLSHLDMDRILTLKRMKNDLLTTMLLAQADVRYNKSSNIAKD